MTKDEILQFISLLFDEGAVEALVVSEAAVNVQTVTTDMLLDGNGSWVFFRIPETLDLKELQADPGDLILVENKKDKNKIEEKKVKELEK